MMNSYQRSQLSANLEKYSERMNEMVSEYVAKGDGSFSLYNKPAKIGYVTSTLFRAHVKRLVGNGILEKKGFDFMGEPLYGYKD